MRLSNLSKLLTTVTAAMVAFAPVATDAACALRDLAGTWRLMVSGQDENGTLLRADCRIVFGRTGSDLSSARCFPERSLNLDLIGDPLGWQFNTGADVGRNCWVRIWLSDNVLGAQLDGHMTRDKELVAGTGALSDEWGTHYESSVLQFDMVRQRQ